MPVLEGYRHARNCANQINNNKPSRGRVLIIKPFFLLFWAGEIHRTQKVHKRAPRVCYKPTSVTNLLLLPDRHILPDPHFSLFADMELPIIVRREDFTWLIARSITRNASGGETDDVMQTHHPEKQQFRSSGIPV